MSNVKRQALIFAACFFVLSGASALAYEVIWFKRFAHVWGSSAHAWASVVAAYLLGLGLGARFAGPIADRVSNPLRIYGAIEIAIGALAFAVPFEIAFLRERVAASIHAAGDSTLAVEAIRFLSTFVVLAPSCILMGATLPLLVRHFALSGVALKRAVAWLYALNALGAALGALIAGFVLLPALGLGGANHVAVLINVVVGALAWQLSARVQPTDPRYPWVRVTATPADPDAPSVPARRLAIAAALCGAAALALQMLWSRELAGVLGPTTYAYSAMLAVFILGLGLGALLFRWIFAGWRSQRGAVLIFVVGLIASTAWGYERLPELARRVGELSAQRGGAWADARVCIATAFALQGLPTVFMGLLFPALVALAESGGAGEGRAVGAVYAWNTLGSIPAALFTQIALLPALGSQLSFKVVLLAYVAALIALFPPLGAARHAVATIVTAACFLAIVFVPRAHDPRLTNLGLYMYGASMLDALPNVETLFFENGQSANVIVLGENEDALPGDPRFARKKRALAVSGKIDATDTADMANQLAIAYFPLLARPAAKDVLVIGMGSGTSAGAALLFPGANVTCAEIEPAIFEAAKLFEHVNHRPHESLRFREVHDDGRNLVQGSTATYDAILSEPSNPWMTGVANLFTHEAYLAMRERLRPGGVFAQWVQSYSLSVREYALIVRTLEAVFPHVALLRINEADTLLVGSTAPLFASDADADAAQAVIDGSAEIRADLERYFGSSRVRTLLLAHWLLDDRGVERFLRGAGGDELHTDAHLQLEFETPRRAFALAAGRPAETGLAQALLASVELAHLRDLIFRLGCDERDARALLAWVRQFEALGEPNKVQQVIELALTIAPDDVAFLAEQLRAPAADPIEQDERVARLVDAAPQDAFRIAKDLAQQGSFSSALPILERLRARHPSSIRVWTSLAAVYAALARDHESEQALERALELDPFDELARSLKQVADEGR